LALSAAASLLPPSFSSSKGYHNHAENTRVLPLRCKTQTTMPLTQAMHWVWMSPNIDRVDFNLATVVRLLGYHTLVLNREGEAPQTEVFIQADSAILLAYLQEIQERRIPKTRFPRTGAAMAETMQAIGKAKSGLLATWEGGYNDLQ
jgi:hypothetical protein